MQVSLSPPDHIPPPNYVVLAYYLPLKKEAGAYETFALLQKGLRKTFVDLPWLNGKVYRMPSDAPGYRPGQLEIRYSPVDPEGEGDLHQLGFSEPNTELTYADLEEAGFPVDAFTDDELFWAPFWADLDAGADVLAAQATFIPGACILTMSTCHSASDGTGMVAILKRWASHCVEGVDRPDPPAAADSDRTVLDRIWEREWNRRPASEIVPAAWHMVGLQPPSEKKATAENANIAPSTPPPAPIQVPQGQHQISSTFYVTVENFKALQEECGPEVSGNDAICALIWRSVLKARTTARRPTASLDAIVSELVLTVDGRPEFSPDLPPGYLGNLVLGSVPTASLASLAGPDDGTRLSVAAVARLIRDKSRTIHHDNIMDAYAVLRGVEDYGMITLPFTSVEGSSMLITSLMMMPVDEVCFGGNSLFENGGHVAACRPLMGGFNRLFRIALVLPRKRRDGVEFCVSLYEDEMELLLDDQEFGLFASQV
ncbi:Shikimate O-hydroxycinnamoyltransferase [Cytospora mali]|uniref:Shikimate O-hydroxycinnamoyltransferase n=1 Tax=Cytospora mali TaxID=578113 RepID=A0A194W849_CYTMA|nr:Shikimate O-hydroxycinnamoyltransferase [Valsa mali]